MPNSISDEIRARAKAEGFDVARFADARANPDNAARLGEFLDAGLHGDMGGARRDFEAALKTSSAAAAKQNLDALGPG